MFENIRIRYSVGKNQKNLDLDVGLVQILLKGVFDDSIIVNGKYDVHTSKAIFDFQQLKGISSSEIVTTKSETFKQLLSEISSNVFLPPSYRTGILKVSRGQFTFDLEGSDQIGPFFSRVIHYPGGASGVTIGRGYDMKLRKEHEIFKHLTGAGVSERQARMISKGAGLKNGAAKQFVERNKYLIGEISHLQQVNLYEIVYREIERDTQRLYNKVANNLLKNDDNFMLNNLINSNAIINRDLLVCKKSVNNITKVYWWSNLPISLKQILVDMRYQGVLNQDLIKTLIKSNYSISKFAKACLRDKKFASYENHRKRLPYINSIQSLCP
ncbi:hypothetical protein [Taylorella asinigenitalis]|uniref:hypothetical protein n=2 Tax=Taylorella asinigenitalis TaxID=84590 RepID=UPI000678B95E|nr:hypothetical protein [Taylorella asinigenitalis]